MNANEQRDGICILSFDNGGPGTYSQLLILKECVIRLASDLQIPEDAVYPADYFDLMGGVGFGGLVALMLGFLRMNVNEAIEGLLDVASTVFPEGPQDTINPVTNTEHLKEAVEGILRIKNVSLDAKMNEVTRAPARCKVALFAATSANLTHPHIFRTYPFRGSSLNPTIVDAVCATMAMPSYFSPVKIGPRLRQQSFVGGALRSHNPTRLLLDEAGMIFGKDRRLAQVISLGCGLPHVLSVGPADEPNVHRALKEITADCEMLAHELSTRLFHTDVYIRLNVERGMEFITMKDWSVLGDIESHTAAYLATTSVSGTIENSLRHLQDRIATITLGHIGQSSSIKVTAKLAPSVSPHFVLRKQPWETIVHHLVTNPTSRQRIFSITGMGGCGKTQIVSYFLQEYESLYKHVIYVDASSSSSIKVDMQTWARALGDGHECAVWEDALPILNSVPKNEQWALILDNADDPNLDLAPFLPKNSNLAVLITSRNRSVGNLSTVCHLELGEMDSDEAFATLIQAARRQLPLSVEEMDSVHNLLKELGCLAVALVQAGTYCYELSSSSRGIFRPYTFTQYLSLFHSHRSDLMLKAEPSSLDGYKKSVYTTLDLSYQALPHRIRVFLHLISFFYHTDIPLEALATAAKRSFEAEWLLLPYPESHDAVVEDLKTLLLDNGRWEEMHVQEAIRTLRSFSLVSVTSISDSLFLQLHPLVQAWSRDLDSTASQHYRAMAIQVLTACASKDNLLLNRNILPHVLDILDQIPLQDLYIDEMMALGKVLQQQGQYRKARQLFETALEVLKQFTSPDNLNTLTVTTYVADAYLEEGKWSEAETLLLELLDRQREALGADHLSTITTAGNLASAYNYQGRWDEAERLRLDVLNQRRRILGMENPATITAAANLASTYHSQGRWSDAEKLELEVLAQSRLILGKGHPDTIVAAGNLASTYTAQGKWNEAEDLQVEVLEQRKKTLGMEHPETIRAATSLASTFGSQGRWSDAEKLELEMLEQYRRVLGMEHPDTLRATSDLAVTYGQQGRWEEALALLVPAVQVSLRVLDQQHPHTQALVKNAAYAYKKLGKSKEAQETMNLLS